MPDVGDARTATLVVTPADVTTAATVALTAPDGTVTAPAVSGSLAGSVWTGTATITFSQAGWWRPVWTVTGMGAGVEPQFMYANAIPPLPGEDPLVCSLEQFKDWIKFPQTDSTQDAKMLLALGAATDWLRWRQGGPLKVTTFTERLWCNGQFLKQRKHPLVAVASVTPQDGSAMSATSYIVDTTNSMIELRGGGVGWYDVVYSAGPAKVSHRRRMAGQEVARHLWGIQNGSSGRGFSGDDVPTPLGFAIPARAEELMSADPDDQQMPGFA